MLQKSDFNYDLPPELIAHQPAHPRDASKLLVLKRQTGEIIDSTFKELHNFLPTNAVLVRNNSKVIKARLIGTKETGGKVEILLNKNLTSTPMRWECVTKPGLKENQTVIFPNSPLRATCKSSDYSNITRIIEFNLIDEEFFTEIEKIGLVPLPPYITQKSDSQTTQTQYQTTYAKHSGSVAAPTAGLHFTNQVENSLKRKNITFAEITLHVGLGTFAPVKTPDITQHTMHSEKFSLSTDVAQELTQAKRDHKPIISVGTTSTRVLESCITKKANQLTFQPTTGETAIYLYPPYSFQAIDGLITNFHLPESTLLMLVSAFTTQPNTPFEFTTFLESPVGKAYQHAIKNHYRFYSFGDAMLII